MQIVMTIRTARSRQALEAVARAECSAPVQIHDETDRSALSALLDGKRRVAITFADGNDCNRFRRALADLPLIAPETLAIKPAPPSAGFFSRLFA